MYDKVQKYWKEEIKRLVGDIGRTNSEIEKRQKQKILDYMRKVEMAVVISEEADEEKKFDLRGLDIRPHRKKMNTIDDNGHDIEYRFKDPPDPLQLVFVCAMWLTGFDAETVSTLYLDKPMKDHTLMQTIARANRVTSFTINGVTKKNGAIIDYYKVDIDLTGILNSGEVFKKIESFKRFADKLLEKDEIKKQYYIYDLIYEYASKGQKWTA